MRSSFDNAFLLLTVLEGFTSDIKEDRGGKTIYGISSKWYPEDVKKMEGMSMEEAKEYAMEFYLREFWKPLRCDKLEEPLDTIHFIQSVNAPAPARKILNETTNWRDYLFKFIMYYSSIVNSNPSQGVFFRGWVNRVLKLWNTFYKDY